MIRPFRKAALPMLAALFCGLLSVSAVHAQIPSSIDGIQIDVNPNNPIPGHNVSIELQSYLTDITTAYITWIVNGKKVAEGVGKTSINMDAPALGAESKVDILIHAENGKDLAKTVTVKSGQVDMVWESEGYVPPLYLGRAAFAYQNDLRITAMPHLAGPGGKEADPATLVYDWKQGTTVLQDQSGYGKQTIQISGGLIPRPLAVSVTVSTRDGTQTAEGVITLNAHSPQLIFYRDDPLYGVLYNASLGSQATFGTPETTVLAAPYSFNADAGGDLQYAWVINGGDQPQLASNRSVTLRVQDPSADGTYPIQLRLQNTRDILQGAMGSINLLFKANKKTNAIAL